MTEEEATEASINKQFMAAYFKQHKEHQDDAEGDD
jgi:hypothetical protein